jgi:hypothetical protein
MGAEASGQEVVMDRIAGSWKMLVGVVAAGAVLLYASLSVEAANRQPGAAQRGSVSAPASDTSGPPASNEIKDFPQLD